MFLLFVSTFAKAALKDETVLFSVENFPPLHAKIPSGEIVGIHKNLADEIFKRLKIDLEHVQFPYARALKLADEGKIGLIQDDEVQKTVENEQYYYPIPGVSVEIKIWTQNMNLNIPETPEQFSGKSFITVRNWPLGQLDEILNENNKDIQLYQVHTPRSAVQMFFLGKRADYLVTYVRPYDLMIKQLNVDVPDVKSKSIHKSYGYSFSIPKKYPYAKELYTKIKQEYEMMVQEGLIDEKQIMLKTDDPYKYFYEK